MAVYQDKRTKKWKCEIWFGGQKLQTRSFSLKAHAVIFEREELQRLEHKKVLRIKAEDHKYEVLFNYWLEDARLRKRETSLAKDVQVHKQHISPIIGELKVSEIYVHHLQKISVSMSEKRLSKSSINKVIQHYKAVFNYSYKHDLILQNPAKNIKQYKIEEKEMEFLSLEEVEQLLQYSNSKYREDSRWKHVFYLCLFTTGLRLGEALALTWDKIRWDSDFLVVEQMWDSKSNRIIPTTKGKKERVVPLHSELKRELGALKNQRKGEFIFTDTGSVPMDASNLRKRMWEKDLKKAGIRHVRIHDARHTYASLFMMAGHNQYDLKKILGHASVSTTEKYAHLSPNHLLGLKDAIKLKLTDHAEVLSMRAREERAPLNPFQDKSGTENMM